MGSFRKAFDEIDTSRLSSPGNSGDIPSPIQTRLSRISNNSKSPASLPSVVLSPVGDFEEDGDYVQDEDDEG